MRSRAPTLERFLVVANVAAAILLVGGTLVLEGPSPEADEPPGAAGKGSVLFVVSAAGTDEMVARRTADLLDGRLLSLPAAGLSDTMRSELSRLDPERVVVVGGPAAVSELLVAELQGFTDGTVSRVAGKDRFATAAQLATLAFPARVERVLVTTGDHGGDAPDGAGLAGPLLLVQRESLPADTAAVLRRLQPREITVLGDQELVSDQLLQRLWGYTPNYGAVGRQRSDEETADAG